MPLRPLRIQPRDLIEWNRYLIDAHRGLTPEELGAAAATAEQVGALLYPPSLAEQAAGIGVVNSAYYYGDIRRYGAKADGQTDASAALQAACDQAHRPGGAQVFVPLGTFAVLQSVSLSPGICIRGHSRETSVLAAAGGISLFTLPDAPDRAALTIEDLTLQGEAGVTERLLALTQAGLCSFNRVRFRCARDLVRLTEDSRGIAFTECEFADWRDAAVRSEALASLLCFERCRFDIGASTATPGSSSCIEVQDAQHLCVSGCEVRGDETLASFIRITGALARSAVRECSTQGLTRACILTSSTGLITGLSVENCTLDTAATASIDFTAGAQQHTGIVVRACRRAASGAQYLLFNPGSATQYEYIGTALPTSTGHVAGFNAFREVRRFAERISVNQGSRSSIGAFTATDVAAGLSNVELSGSRWVAPRAGYITAVAVRSSEARSAGSLTVEVYNSALATGLTATLDEDHPTSRIQTQHPGVDSFAAGDELYAVLSTDGAWEPLTADIRVFIEIEM